MEKKKTDPPDDKPEGRAKPKRKSGRQVRLLVGRTDYGDAGQLLPEERYERAQLEDHIRRGLVERVTRP